MYWESNHATKHFETLLNDNPKKYKYNPYPIYSEIVLLFLEFIEEIEHLQDIALLHEYFNRYLLAICWYNYIGYSQNSRDIAIYNHIFNYIPNHATKQ
jgi:hypothetical protein